MSTFGNVCLGIEIWVVIHEGKCSAYSEKIDSNQNPIRTFYLSQVISVNHTDFDIVLRSGNASDIFAGLTIVLNTGENVLWAWTEETKKEKGLWLCQLSKLYSSSKNSALSSDPNR
jgi:hypothetical protein